MDLRRFNVVEWKYTTPLTAAQNLVVPLAMELSPETVAAGSDLLLATFSIFSTVATTVNFQGSVNAAFTNPRLLATLAVVAATFTTAYALPVGLATNGVILVTLPFVRWNLVDTGGGSAVTEFYAKAWM